MHLRQRRVIQVGFAAFPCEEDVILAPEDDGLRLLFTEKLLPRLQGYVRAVVVEQIELEPGGLSAAL
jgi:hypothetical protein